MRATLGEFEHLILLATVRLGDDAYGAAIIDHLEQRTGRDVSQAATYIVLKRLEEKGLVTSALGAATPERGGRPKRYFAVSPMGLERLRTSGSAIMNMWDGLEDLLEQAR
jgi:PadR family transcriptional regulator PadR